MNYRIIDSHCHPQFPQYNEDRDSVIRNTLGKGIGLLCVGTDLEKSRQAVELAEKYEGVYASVGLHPNDELGTVYDEEAYRLLAQHPKVVAIGEVGLDYYRTTEKSSRRKQRERFIAQLRLARSLSLPTIIHCREASVPTGVAQVVQSNSAQVGAHEPSAHEDMLAILREYYSGLPAVMHSFNGSIKHAHSYLNEGLYLGLNAIVTFSHQYDDMVKAIPADRILLETDAPYLAPAPHRGQRNEPIFVEAVGNYIAALRKRDANTFFQETAKNTRKLFNI